MSVSEQVLIDRFWDFVVSHEERISNIERHEDLYYDQLLQKIAVISKSVVLEISPKNNDQNFMLIFSSEGRKEVAETINRIVDASPSLQLISIQKFRPKMSNIGSLYVQSSGQSIPLEKITFEASFYDDLYDLDIFIPGFDKDDPVAAYSALLALNLLVGEETILNRVGCIDIKPTTGGAGATQLTYLPFLMQLDQARCAIQ